MTSASRLTTITLNVKDPAALAVFYCDMLGMHRLDHPGGVAVGYGGEGAALVLNPVASGPDYAHATHHRYWKIAITVPNLDLAHQQLAKSGVAASDPHQFREIAYMSHLADPEGHIVELIQHTFDGKPRTTPGDATQPLGGGAQIGLVTLRTDDVTAETGYFLDELGMAYLSRQDVADKGFDLYFFAATDDVPPNEDVNAVENREWLWQRPYTTLEFLHPLNGSKISATDKDHRGAATITIDNGDGTQTLFS